MENNNITKRWFYDEAKHCGVDYSDAKLASQYDTSHQMFRNYEKEFNEMLEFLNLDDLEKLSVIDMGCGTGAIAKFAAQKFSKVYAVDIAPAMLEQASSNLPDELKSKVAFKNAGFLSYEHTDEPVDLIMTKAAFHHLPDFWKQVGLLRMNRMLKPGASLYIHDVVFHFQAMDYLSKIDNWITIFGKLTNDDFKREVEVHIRDEFSTFHWILEGMINKAGFSIKNYRTNDEFVTEYHCVKTQDIG